MATILDRIILEKQKEIIGLKNHQPSISPNIEQNYSLISHLENSSQLAIIAEYKRASPSKGVINNLLEPAQQAIVYEKNGAAAISVLTDSTFFKGSFQDLHKIRESVELPILCKDFIIDKVQIDFAKRHGANIILLIAAALSTFELKELYGYARAQNLEVLVEVHNEEEAEKALLVGPRLIGINNRNLKTFEVNLEVTERIVPFVQSSGAHIISESGIFSKSDAEMVRDAGVSGVLVGEALMKSQDVSYSFQQLKVNICKWAKI